MIIGFKDLLVNYKIITVHELYLKHLHNTTCIYVWQPSMGYAATFTEQCPIPSLHITEGPSYIHIILFYQRSLHHFRRKLRLFVCKHISQSTYLPVRADNSVMFKDRITPWKPDWGIMNFNNRLYIMVLLFLLNLFLLWILQSYLPCG